jgi:DNA invertase Pin-like site-specific DNA recombinase
LPWTAEFGAFDDLDRAPVAGCENILAVTVSGAKAERPGLTKVFEQLGFGDTLVVWQLDRLGLSLPHRIETVTHVRDNSVEFTSLHEQNDTSM